MSKYFNGNKLSGYEDSPITYVYGGNLEECHKVISDLEAKLAERGKEIAIRNEKLNELKNELHKRNESLERKKQQVEDVHKAVKQAKRESARKGRQVCYANNEVVQYQKQIKQLKQQLAEKDAEVQSWKDGTMVVKLCELEKQLSEKKKELEEVKKSKTYIMNFGDKVKEVQVVDDNQDKISFAVDILEEIADCSNYINSKLDFECGSYVSEKAIRDKIKYLKGKQDE